MKVLEVEQDTRRQDTIFKRMAVGTPLAVQWLRLHASIAGGKSSVPGQGAKILHAVHAAKKIHTFFKKTGWNSPWGYDINWLEPTRWEIVEDSTSTGPWASLYTLGDTSATDTPQGPKQTAKAGKRASSPRKSLPFSPKQLEKIVLLWKS